MDRHSSLLRPGKRHPASLVNHLFHCEFKIQCVLLFVVLSLVVGLSFFGQVVMVEYLPSFICLEGIGFVNHLSLLWFRAIMIPAAPYTDSGLLSIIYPAALCGYRIYCSSSPSYLRFGFCHPVYPTKVSGYGDFGPGFETWSLSSFVDPLFAYFVLGMLAVASIIFHHNLFWISPSSCSRLSTHHLTSDVRHGLEPVAPVQVYGLKPSMLFGILGLLLNLPSFEYPEASHFLQG